MGEALIFAGCAVGVFAVYFAARAVAGRDVPADTTQLATTVGLRVATLHGLIIALVFAQLALVFRNLETELSEEAQTVSDIYFDARRHGGPGADAIVEAARRYVDLVLDHEWAEARTGANVPDPEAQDAVASIYDAALGLAGATPAEAALRDAIIVNVRELGELRFARESRSQPTQAVPFWFAAVSGLVLMSACFFAFDPTRRNLALIGAFGIYNGIVLALIHMYSHPFTAPGALDPAAFERVRAAMGG
jgi:hypothetical protein